MLTENNRGIAFYESCGFQRVSGSEKRFEFGGREVEEVAYVRGNDFFSVTGITGERREG